MPRVWIIGRSAPPLDPGDNRNPAPDALRGAFPIPFLFHPGDLQ